MTDPTPCCPVRNYFVMAIVAHRTDIPAPAEIADYVEAWEPKIIVRTVYCPFCGKRIRDDEPRIYTGLPRRGGPDDD